MKFVAPDTSAIYYTTVPHNGELHGLRFAHGTVAALRGQDNDNPASLSAVMISTLPVGPDHPTGELYDAIASVIHDHPEIADLLSGRIALEQASGKVTPIR